MELTVRPKKDFTFLLKEGKRCLESNLFDWPWVCLGNFREKGEALAAELGEGTSFAQFDVEDVESLKSALDGNSFFLALVLTNSWKEQMKVE
jgi:hypothetical protein